MSDVQNDNETAAEPAVMDREDIIDIFFWIAGGLVAAGALASWERLLLSPIVGGAIFAVVMCVAILLGLVSRRRCRRKKKQPERGQSTQSQR